MSSGRTANRTDPFLDKVLRGWIANTARENLFRVEPDLDLDDLIQEGLLCYAKCRRRYTELAAMNHPGKGERMWMQKLVETSFIRRIHTLASRRELHEHYIVGFGDPVETQEIESIYLPPDHSDQTFFSTLLATAPQDIQDLLLAVAGGPDEITRYVRRRYIAKGAYTPEKPFKRQMIRETTNEYLCRLAGVNPEHVDMVARLRAYFLEGELVGTPVPAPGA